jgi:predicted nucleic-acid-binding Zn-ribbon protein
MNKIQDEPCSKCGGDTFVRYIQSSGMDIQPTGLKRECMRCGFYEFIKSLDSKDNICLADLKSAHKLTK